LKKRRKSSWICEKNAHKRAGASLNRPRYRQDIYAVPSVLGRRTVVLPSELDLFTNRGREELYALLRQIASVPELSKLTLDFSKLAKIKISALLIFYAHLEVMLESKVARKLLWVKSTDANINAGLSDIGIWALLGEDYKPQQGTIRICSVSHEQNQSDNKQALREAITYAKDAIAFYQSPELSEEADDAAFGAISESFTNVWQHAYAEDLQVRYRTLDKALQVKKWWIALRHIDGQLFMAVYDVGVGIPSSTRRKGWYGSVKQDILSLVTGLSPDNQDIKTALEYGSSRYKVQGRGNGLPTMKKFVEINPNGALRIMSGEGMYRFRSFNSSEEWFDLDANFPGTLVQWNIALGAGGENDEA
jgi:anti-sigma regulatory factor (Ser/Thr protein kinase)